jgi:hypothetical protein
MADMDPGLRREDADVGALPSERVRLNDSRCQVSDAYHQPKPWVRVAKEPVSVGRTLNVVAPNGAADFVHDSGIALHED